MILVTGAAGRVGIRLVEQLATAHTPVRVLVHNPDQAIAFKDFNVKEIITGDLNCSETIKTALEGVESLCSIPPNIYCQAHMECRLFDAAKLANVKYILKLSSVKAKHNSSCHFFREHWLAEEHLKKNGIPFTILQSNSFMQNLLWFTKEINTSGSFSLPTKDAKTAPVDIRDIATVAFTLLLTKDKEQYCKKTYNITGSKNLSFSDMAKQISISIGRKVTYKNIPQEIFRKTLLDAGLQGWYVEAVLSAWAIASEESPNVTSTITDISGKLPITFEKFTQDYVQLYLNFL